jgi:iron complex transport system substrate-binding protein
LFAAGAGDAVVGVVDFSDYPPAAKQIQNIGDHQNYDLELILSLRPDLVVAWGSGSSNEKIRKLKSLGLTVYVMEPRRFEGIANNIDKLGRLAGTDKTARDASNHFRDTYKQLKEKYADKKKLQVFFQIWNQPLMTINGQHLISDVIRLCGGTNIFSGLLSLAPGIDIEAVLASNPDVIVVSGDEENRSKWIDDWYKWPNLKAVKNNHLFLVPADLINRQTPRILLGAQQMCEQFERVRRKSAGRHE